MARCGCASDQCACHFIAGEGVAITGAGTRSNPYVVTSLVTDGGGGGGGGGTVDRLVGEIIAYGGSVAPAGWRLCDGSLLNRVLYADLYGVLGTAYGAGDGVTTFAIPDLRAKFPIGVGTGVARGSTGGVTTHTLTTAHLPLHSHTMAHTHAIDHNHASFASATGGAHDHEMNSSSGEGFSSTYMARGNNDTGLMTNNAAILSDGGHAHTIDVPAYTGTSGASSAASTGATGSASPTALDNRPPYQAVNYIIKT